jgi:hypothetical protein
MTERVEEILSRYGQTVSICRGTESVSARAFVQLTGETGHAAPYQVTTLGTMDDRTWRILTRQDLQDGDTVVWNGGEYTVETCWPVYLGEKLSHWQGIMTRRREAAT